MHIRRIGFDGIFSLWPVRLVARMDWYLMRNIWYLNLGYQIAWMAFS